MSVSISYRPLSERGYLDGATEFTVRALKRTFGEFPLSLNDAEHLTLLEAMAYTYDHRPNPYSDLALALVHNGSLRVKVEC